MQGRFGRPARGGGARGATPRALGPVKESKVSSEAGRIGTEVGEEQGSVGRCRGRGGKKRETGQSKRGRTAARKRGTRAEARDDETERAAAQRGAGRRKRERREGKQRWIDAEKGRKREKEKEGGGATRRRCGRALREGVRVRQASGILGRVDVAPARIARAGPFLLPSLSYGVSHAFSKALPSRLASSHARAPRPALASISVAAHAGPIWILR